MKDLWFVAFLSVGIFIVGLGLKEFYEQGLAPRLGNQEQREFEPGPILTPLFNTYDVIEDEILYWFGD